MALHGWLRGHGDPPPETGQAGGTEKDKRAEREEEATPLINGLQGLWLS